MGPSIKRGAVKGGSFPPHCALTKNAFRLIEELRSGLALLKIGKQGVDCIAQFGEFLLCGLPYDSVINYRVPMNK